MVEMKSHKFKTAKVLTTLTKEGIKRTAEEGNHAEREEQN